MIVIFMAKKVMNKNLHKKRIQNNYDFLTSLLNDKEMELIWIVLIVETNRGKTINQNLL